MTDRARDLVGVGGGKEGSLPAPRTRHKQPRGNVALFDESDEQQPGQAAADHSGSMSARERHVEAPSVRWRRLSYLRAVWPMFGDPNLAWLEPRIRRSLSLSYARSAPAVPFCVDLRTPRCLLAAYIVRLRRGVRCQRSPSTPRATRHTNKVPTHLRLEQHDARRWPAIGWDARLTHAHDPSRASLRPSIVPSPATAQRLDTTCPRPRRTAHRLLPDVLLDSIRALIRSPPAAPAPTGTAAARSRERAPSSRPGVFGAIAS